jgi:hypothetical protein
LRSPAGSGLIVRSPSSYPCQRIKPVPATILSSQGARVTLMFMQQKIGPDKIANEKAMVGPQQAHLEKIQPGESTIVNTAESPPNSIGSQVGRR